MGKSEVFDQNSVDIAWMIERGPKSWAFDGVTIFFQATKGHIYRYTPFFDIISSIEEGSFRRFWFSESFQNTLKFHCFTYLFPGRVRTWTPIKKQIIKYILKRRNISNAPLPQLPRHPNCWSDWSFKKTKKKLLNAHSYILFSFGLFLAFLLFPSLPHPYFKCYIFAPHIVKTSWR